MEGEDDIHGIYKEQESVTGVTRKQYYFQGRPKIPGKEFQVQEYKTNAESWKMAAHQEYSYWRNNWSEVGIAGKTCADTHTRTMV